MINDQQMLVRVLVHYLVNGLPPCTSRDLTFKTVPSPMQLMHSVVLPYLLISDTSYIKQLSSTNPMLLYAGYTANAVVGMKNTSIHFQLLHQATLFLQLFLICDIEVREIQPVRHCRVSKQWLFFFF